MKTLNLRRGLLIMLTLILATCQFKGNDLDFSDVGELVFVFNQRQDVKSIDGEIIDNYWVQVIKEKQDLDQEGRGRLLKDFKLFESIDEGQSYPFIGVLCDFVILDRKGEAKFYCQQVNWKAMVSISKVKWVQGKAICSSEKVYTMINHKFAKTLYELLKRQAPDIIEKWDVKYKAATGETVEELLLQ